METNKTILMREVVSIGERKTVGAVKDIRIDCEGRSVSHFVIGDFVRGASRVLPYKGIRAVGDTFVTINKEDAFLDPASKPSKDLLEDGFKLVGVEVFSGDGDRIGSIGGFEFDPKTGSISSITLGDGAQYDASSVLFFSPKFVFVDGEAVAKEEPKQEEVKEEVKAEAPAAVPVSAPAPAAAPAPAPAPVAAPVAAPAPAPAPVPVKEEVKPEPESVVKEAVVEEKKEVASEPSEEDSLRELLIGKKVSVQVKSKDGEFSIDKGSVITDEVFKEAAAHDVLLLLAVNVDA